MAAIKNLKKDIHNTLGDLIEACYVWEYSNVKADNSKTQPIIDEAMASFDELRDNIYAKDIENKKAHFKSIRLALETSAKSISEKINAL
ncbi:hypothetical protein [Flavicella sp.]|uniref:hypothetical protein n=1 Tax=Flavicella sp. TaxID=2957742 RepID=UPI00301B1120